MSDDSDVDSQNSDVDDTYDADTSSQGSRGSSRDDEKSAGELENNLGDEIKTPDDADKEEHNHDSRKGSDAGSTSDRAKVEEDDDPGSTLSETGSVKTTERDSRAGSVMSANGRTRAAREGDSVRPSSASSRESGKNSKLEDSQMETHEGRSEGGSENEDPDSCDDSEDDEEEEEAEVEGEDDGEKTPVPPLEINIFSGSSFDAEGDEGTGPSRQGSMASMSAEGERSSAASGSMSLRPPSSESDRRFLEVCPTFQTGSGVGYTNRTASQSDDSERSQSATQDNDGEEIQERAVIEEDLKKQRPSSGKSETASLQPRPPSAESKDRKRRRKSGSKTSLRSDGEMSSRAFSVSEDNAASPRPSSGRSTSSRKDNRPGSVASGHVSIQSLPVKGNVERPTFNRPKSADIRGRNAKMDRSEENTDGENDTISLHDKRLKESEKKTAGDIDDTETRQSRRSLHSAKSNKSFRSIASTRLDYLAELADIKEKLEGKTADWEGLTEDNLEGFLEDLRELYGRTTAVLRNSHRDSICLMERIVQVRKLLKETRRKLRDETSDRSLSSLDEKDPGPSQQLTQTVQQARATLARAVAEAAEAERSAAAAEVAAAEAAAAAGRTMAAPETETKNTEESEELAPAQGDDVTDKAVEDAQEKETTMATEEGETEKTESEEKVENGETEGKEEDIKDTKEEEQTEESEEGAKAETDDTPDAESTGNEEGTGEREQPPDETADAATEERKVSEEEEVSEEQKATEEENETQDADKQGKEEAKETTEGSEEKTERKASKLEDIKEVDDSEKAEEQEEKQESGKTENRTSPTPPPPTARRRSEPTISQAPSPRGNQGSSQAMLRRGSLMDVRLRQAERTQRDAMKDPNNWPMEALQVENLDGESEVGCLIRATSDVLDSPPSPISASYLHHLSHLTVGSNEELVSEVVDLQPRGHTLPGPLIVAVPYPVSARVGSREVIVKTSQDGEKWRAIPTFNPEANYRERKGVFFAEVNVKQLGMFAVLSRPAREKIHVPTKGGLFKAPQDQRVSFKYAKEGVKTPLMLTLEIQPVSMSVVADVKSREKTCEGLISCSPIVRMSHSVNIHTRDSPPITVTVPVPPNPSRAAAEESNTSSRRPKTAFEGGRSSDAASRPMSAFSLGTRSSSAQDDDDTLRLMTWEEGGWLVHDDVELTERKGDLVAFELKVVLQRFIILRLKTGSHYSPEKVVRALEKSLRTKRAACIARHRADDPQSLVFKCVPAADSNKTLRALEDSGYVGPPDASSDVLLTEGQLIYMRLLGNITEADDSSKEELRLPFHCHVHKSVRLKVKEQDEFANHSYDEYRGQVKFFLRENNEHDGKETSLCKLPVSLPKKERPRPRPPSSYRKLIEVPGPLGTDGLNHLAREMGEDWDVVAGYLKVKHSRVQAIKRNYPGDIKQQAFDMLYTWRNSMPRHCDKVGVLYKALRKSDRGDLAEKLRAQTAA
ncbi:dentin sialophosphoprotein-like [Branchiostoma floridae]|uniref:Dentin sialophosphoprotein-like n=1 Tax=Branchiostoma floridae TaxID=7739 RepID=A0A9J7HUQ3_BRAFL|nr:dentin sialophosphoprotein-like [Branchiostoma floridae]